uniref:Uncharacterized protein n=1 Tax=Emiliania huxleyi TaxID=2903 RepID=A0A7S3U391_EMIHU
MGWEEAAAGFPELPKGRSLRKVWIDPGTFPVIAVAGIAACMMTTFIHKHFFGSTEIAMYKSQRTVPDHSDAHRVDVQNSRRNLLGNMAWMDLNKSKMTLFPFSYVPREETIAAHRTD